MATCPPEAIELLDSAIEILVNDKSLKVAGLDILELLQPERHQNYYA